MVIVHNGGHYELVFHSGAWRRSVRIGLRPANLIQPRRASVRATECTFRIAVFCVGREHRRATANSVSCTPRWRPTPVTDWAAWPFRPRNRSIRETP